MRRPAVPSRRRTVPRRVNILFFLHARVFTRYSTTKQKKQTKPKQTKKKEAHLLRIQNLPICFETFRLTLYLMKKKIEQNNSLNLCHHALDFCNSIANIFPVQ